MSYKKNLNKGWLLLFYSVPSRPVANRVKLWRKLAKAGAIHLKGAVYILPYSDAHYEFLQWLMAEIASMKGDGMFVRVDKLETMKDSEIVELFKKQKASEYKVVEKKLSEYERRLGSVKKGSRNQDAVKLPEKLSRLEKDIEAIRKTDFFLSNEGAKIEGRIKSLRASLRDIAGHGERVVPATTALVYRKKEDYQNKTWITRQKPFVDRIASAWLIKGFIDKNATFRTMDEKDIEKLDMKNSVTFDVRGGEFTHIGDMCTFETLVKSFNIKDNAVKKIAEIVHEIDIKDEKFVAPETTGIEEVLTGIQVAAKDDMEIFEKGILVFEMLYAAKS